MKLLVALFLILNFTFLFGHEGHSSQKEKRQESVSFSSIQEEEEEPMMKQFGRPLSWAQWIGSFHFTFLHFPIALIVMTAISELLFALKRKLIYDFAARFMLISAAIFAVPTAIFGLVYSYTASYEGLFATFVWRHMWLGIATAVIAIIVAVLRERYGVSLLYYACLVILFLSVNITGFLGGGMTFGPYNMLPPY